MCDITAGEDVILGVFSDAVSRGVTFDALDHVKVTERFCLG